MVNKKMWLSVAVILFVITVMAVYGYSQTVDENDKTPQDVVEGDVVNDEVLLDGPVIEIMDSLHDFGEVVYGEVASHNFVVKNRGDQPLEILQLSTSCGCTKATIEEGESIIYPGEQATVMVTFDPAVHGDDTDVGQLRRIIYIQTNDASNPEVEAEIKANVIKRE